MRKLGDVFSTLSITKNHKYNYLKGYLEIMEESKEKTN